MCLIVLLTLNTAMSKLVLVEDKRLIKRNNNKVSKFKLRKQLKRIKKSDQKQIRTTENKA